jgi:YggT family protein
MNIIFSYIAGILVIFLSLIEYIIIIEIILSWLILVGIQVRIGFFAAITQPLYLFIRKILPTTLWPIDFTPVILLIIIQFLTWLLLPFTPIIF